MDENFIISKGWVKSEWVGSTIWYIHSKFNYENDGFFIVLKVYDKSYVSIFEESGNDKQIIFRGYLKTNEDLEKIMELLEFHFN